jgi:hypothetical protein
VGRPMIGRMDVERLLGRPMTNEDVATAWARGATRRQINRRHYLKRLAREAGAALADRCHIRPRSPA